jgi:ribose-phosphate pyrophosphokinase
LRKVDAPFAAELPGAKADDGGAKIGLAERAVAHSLSLENSAGVVAQIRLARGRVIVTIRLRFIRRVRRVFFFLTGSNHFYPVKIFSGTANEPLARAICKSIGVELGQCTISPFPDGETFVRIEENVRGEDIFIIQPTSPPTNHNLMELFIMIDALRRASAKRITAVMPFYGYARQDRKDQPRVPITAKLVANLLVAAGANRVLTMDLHAQQIQGFFDIPVDHLYAAPVMYEYLKKKNLTNLVVVSPDAGGIKMAHAYSQTMEAELAIVAKRRKSATEVESMAVIGDIDGKNVLLVDDLTETAGTLTSAAAVLKTKGAKNIMACVSHALLNDVGIERLRKSAIDELITTDTVQRPAIDGVKITTLSVAGLLGEAIKRIHNNSSVNSLFEFKGGRTS